MNLTKGGLLRIILAAVISVNLISTIVDAAVIILGCAFDYFTRHF